MKTKSTRRSSDTDSVASSSYSCDIRAPKPKKMGVSPLNRRRSIRIAEAMQRLNRDSTMQDVSCICRQDTVIMETPSLQRMETSHPFKHWRRKRTLASQETTFHGGKRPALIDDLMEEDSSHVGSLLRKETTTTNLQSVLQKTTLGPSVRGKLKRKASHTNDALGEPAQKRRGAGFDRPALQSTLSIKEMSPVYIPPKRLWPLTLSEQIVWQVPMKKENGCPARCTAVYVDDNRCVLADDQQKVVHLDSDVRPTAAFKVPFNVTCLTADGNVIYAGTDAESVYDVSQCEPKLVLQAKGFGQVLDLSVSQGHAVASNELGHVVHFTPAGDELWREKSGGEQGWMVQINEDAVYHGHSKGLAKLDARDGSKLWETETTSAVLSGVLHSESALIASGSQVLKVDEVSGDILQTYNKGSSDSAVVHCVAVGGGVVFAAGRKLVCYDEKSGEVVYCVKMQHKPESIKYFCGRLFCACQGGLLVLDFTQNTIEDAQSGKSLETVDVQVDLTSDNCEADAKPTLTKRNTRRGIKRSRSKT